MRLFIAVPLPDKVKDALLEIREPIEGVRWQNPEQMHLTLKFLGDTPRQEISGIEQELKQLAAEPFSMDISGVGQFPKSGPPRVVWAGVSDNELLLQLQAEVEKRCSKLGFPPEDREYHPHITLARVKNNRNSAIEELIHRHSDFSLNDIPVDRLVLYESQLQPEGAVHNPLTSFTLK